MACDEYDIGWCRPEAAGHSEYEPGCFEKQDGVAVLHEQVLVPVTC